MPLQVTTLVLAAWVVATLVFYRLLGPTRGALLAILGGWAFLPTGAYPAEMIAVGQERWGWEHALAVASVPFWNKASAIGLGCLLGMALFDGPSLRRLRLGWVDGFAVLLIATPLVSAVSNGLPISEGLCQARHMALAWGVPYLVGRTRFGQPGALLEFARGWTLAGLATAPLALVEVVLGPIVYGLLYGIHAYKYEGVDRWIGHRPLILLEHGNQWGMWSATAALAATWLWLAGERSFGRIGGWSVPSGAVSLLLVGVCVVGQSHGSLVLLALGILPMVLYRLRVPAWAVGGGLAALLAVVGGLGLAMVARAGGPQGLRVWLRGVFRSWGKSSFTWRLARVEEHFETLAQRPVLGWGRADWSHLGAEGRFVNPVNLSYFFVEAGAHGVIGALGAAGLMMAPVVRAWSYQRRMDWEELPESAVILASVLVAINLVDLMQNSVLLLPVLVAAGGLVTWAPPNFRERGQAKPAWDWLGRRIRD